jgi:hypothetical protein
MNKEEFNLKKPVNVAKIAKVFMDWLGGDCISVNNYIEDPKGLTPILSIYHFDDEPLRPLYRLTPNTPGNYEIIKTDKIELSCLETQLDDEVRRAIFDDLSKI